VSILAASGYCALRFEEGFPEWKTRGLAVETGSDLEGVR
jgi:hypothetical protein